VKLPCEFLKLSIGQSAQERYFPEIFGKGRGHSTLSPVCHRLPRAQSSMNQTQFNAETQRRRVSSTPMLLCASAFHS